MATEHDDAVDKVLAALNNAAPPQGMEARITQRLQQPIPAAQPAWRLLLTGASPSGAWWRGALTGGLLATAAACGLFLFESHSLRPSPPPPPIANSAIRPPAVPISETLAMPCSLPSILRAHTNAPSASVTIARGAVPEHRLPFVQLGLTSQERALVQLTRVAEPHQIATLNSETQASVDAADAAAFKKFFTPPPRPRIDQWQPPSGNSDESVPNDQFNQPQSDEEPTPSTPDSKGPQ